MQNLDVTMLLNHIDVHATIEHLVNVVPWTLDEECVRGLTLSVRPQAHGVRAFMCNLFKDEEAPGAVSHEAP